MMKPKYVLDYTLVKEQIDRLLQSVPNKLEREWVAPTTPAFLVLLGTVTTIGNTRPHTRRAAGFFALTVCSNVRSRQARNLS